MSDKSTFDLKHISEVAYVEPSGVLDQLNLPPAVVKFIRDNQRLLQVAGVITVVLVVAVSLYQSYRQNRLENGASSLSISMEGEGEAKLQAIEHVAEEFAGTPSALWAATELGHMAMKDGAFEKAAGYYRSVRQKVSTSNPMYGLLTFAIAQADEAGKKYADAVSVYSELKGIEGYKDEGYAGMARVYEVQGDTTGAIGIYEEYLGTIIGEDNNEQVKRLIEEKITRLRVKQ